MGNIFKIKLVTKLVSTRIGFVVLYLCI